MYLKELGEKRIIEGLKQRFTKPHPRVIKAIGDDTSVTVESSDRVLLATTDILVEDVHFSLEYTAAYLLGRKSLSISISDIAAMGGEPVFFLVSIALPPDTRKDFLDELYKGIKDVSEEFGCALVGGNTSSIDGKSMVSTTVLGEAQKGCEVLRNGARPGEIIFATGTLGDSALGLEALKDRGKEALSSGPFKKPALKHLDPCPRVSAGKALAERRLATSMIDISDGLVSDLKEITTQSGVGAMVEFKKLPMSDELREHISLRPESITLPLCGGEDYELLFTAPEEKTPEINSLGDELSLPITEIGKIVDKERGVRGAGGVEVLDEKGRPMSLESEGFDHF